MTPRPDILVSADAGMVAVRDASRALRVMATRRDEFVAARMAGCRRRRALEPDEIARSTAFAAIRNGCVARLAGRARGRHVTDRGSRDRGL